MTTKYGVFSETVHLAGDTLADAGTAQRQRGGATTAGNFKVPTCKQGKHDTFGKLQPLFAGEPFVESMRSARRQQNAGKKHVSERAWRVASPMKQSACPGDWCGTMQGKPLPYVAGTVEVAKRKGEVVGTPPNIRAGKANTATCRQQLAHGIAGEYDYIADPIHQATRQAAPAGPTVPFRPVNPPKKGGPGTLTRNFGNRPKGAVGEFEWQPRPEAPDQRGATGPAAGSADASPAAAATAAAAAEQQRTAFKPAAVPRKGPLATFMHYPEYLHDPETLHTEARRQQRAKERELLAAHAGGAWQPGGQVKTDATRSIMRMNL